MMIRSLRLKLLRLIYFLAWQLIACTAFSFCYACKGKGQSTSLTTATAIHSDQNLDRDVLAARTEDQSQLSYDLSRLFKRAPPTPLTLPTSKAHIPLPHKLNLISKLTFSWVDRLMRLGGNRTLELTDLWVLPTEQRADSSSLVFQRIFDHERRKDEEQAGMKSHSLNTLVGLNKTSHGVNKPQQSSNILGEYWRSPVTRALVKMYLSSFIASGATKLVNTLVQFLPSLIITRIFSYLASAKPLSAASGPLWQRFITNRGVQLSLLLFTCLTMKTSIENQYFDMIVSLSAKVRGTVSAAIYQKSLTLGASGRQNTTLGEIVNLIQLDSGRLEYVVGSIHTVWDGILQIAGYTALLLHFLGPAVFAGIAAMLVIIPLNQYFLGKLSTLRETTLKYTDQRVKLTNEILQGIRSIKSYNWEQPFRDRLKKLREKEMKLMKESAKVRSILISALFAAPSFVAVFTLSIYALLGNELVSAKVFTSLALFNQLRFPLTFFPMLLNALAEGKASLQRITRFLLAPTVQGYVESDFSPAERQNGTDYAKLRSTIYVENGQFSWTESAAPRKEVGARGRLNDINLSIRKGELLAVVGPTGSGKTTLLNALLGELNKEDGRVVVRGKVAYVPQNSWIPNDTIRNIILFGQPMNWNRYREALRVSGLLRDLELLEAGDLTEIGEKGANLSGGQKQRLSIARAFYHDADVYLFDDPLSALDSDVGSRVFRTCIRNSLFGKTRVLVTHQLSVLSQVDRIILMDKVKNSTECHIVDQGSLPQLVSRGHDLSRFLTKMNEKDEAVESAPDDRSVSEGMKEVAVPSAHAVQLLNETLVDDGMAGVSIAGAGEQLEASSDPTDKDLSANMYVGNVPPTGAMVDCVGSNCLLDELSGNSPQQDADADSMALNTTAVPSDIAGVEVKSNEPQVPIDAVPPSIVKALVSKEERGEGVVGWQYYRDYFGESQSPLLIAALLLSFLFANTSQILQQWVITAWTNDAKYARFPLPVYLSGVAGMAINVAFFTFLRSYLGNVLGSMASQRLHDKMVDRVLRAPLSYFESTPVGRLLQRFSKDLDQVDLQLPGSFGQLIASTLQIVGSMTAICVITPTFGVVMLFIGAVYGKFTNYYRAVARDLKRLDSISRSPIYSHFSETLGGLPVIRSFRREALYRVGNAVKIDDNLAAFLSLKAVDRWLSIRLECLGNIVVLFASLLVSMTSSKAGAAGFSLTNALGITSLLNWAVRNAAETESLMNSVERVYYIARETPQEREVDAKKDTSTQSTSLLPSNSVSPSISPPAADLQLMPSSDSELRTSGWPWRAGLVFHNVTMRYRDDFAPVLHGVNLDIRPGERIGIVGRTGSGKSSLFRGLLRLNELEGGSIAVDGVDLARIGLDTLRSSISIIPQDPVLFSGSIRQNLDPFSRYSDEVLWDALRKSNLYQTISQLPGGLSYEVAEGGENFSAGQRQLLCLARALLRKCPILLLDEATSSVDYDTDAFIQRSIREEFNRQESQIVPHQHADMDSTGGRTTILTIAHRLSTILDADRVLVMDAGQVKEFDDPRVLLSDPHSSFAQLVAAEARQQDNEHQAADHLCSINVPTSQSSDVAITTIIERNTDKLKAARETLETEKVTT